MSLLFWVSPFSWGPACNFSDLSLQEHTALLHTLVSGKVETLSILHTVQHRQHELFKTNLTERQKGNHSSIRNEVKVQTSNLLKTKILHLHFIHSVILKKHLLWSGVSEGGGEEKEEVEKEEDHLMSSLPRKPISPPSYLCFKVHLK